MSHDEQDLTAVITLQHIVTHSLRKVALTRPRRVSLGTIIWRGHRTKFV